MYNLMIEKARIDILSFFLYTIYVFINGEYMDSAPLFLSFIPIRVG